MIRAARQQNSDVEGIEFLFVYGSLRESIHHPMRNLLVRQGTCIGTGSLQGKLYDLGRYPGVVLSTARTDRVLGEVFRIIRSQQVLKLLDEYEGRRFKREQVAVVIDDVDKSQISCWAYIYKRSINGRVYIPSGDYLEYRRYLERDL